MSTSDKLIYLNGTKQALKDSINNIGGSITDETTFRAYAEELDTIYDNLPKTTGTGSNLSLNTLKGRINVDDILGDTQQEGTPTPDTPIDIQVVTGEQQVLVRGTNLFDGELEQGTINNSGENTNNASSNNYMRAKNFIPILPNTRTIISTPDTNIITDTMFVYYYDKNKTFITSTSFNYASVNGGYAFMTNASASYMRLRPRYQTNDTTIKFMIEHKESGPASEWQPYQEQTKIVNLSSKNLLNITSLQQGIVGATTLTYVDDILTLKSGAYGSSFANLETKTLKANTQYIYELFLTETSTNSAKVSLIVQKEGNTNIINSGQITFGDQTYYSFTYTPTEDTKILRLQFYNSSTTPITADISFKVQLREASSESGYMPYYNYELCKIGTYQDRIFKAVEGNSVYDSLSSEVKATLDTNKWYIEKNIGKKVLNGSENWTIQKTGTPNWFYALTDSGIDIITDSTTNNSMCDHYTWGSVGNSNTNTGYYIVKSGSVIHIRYGTEDTIANYKTWLASHNTLIYYVMETPTYEEITNTNLLTELNELEKMMSYNGTTNINISGNLPMLVSVSALKGESE